MMRTVSRPGVIPAVGNGMAAAFGVTNLLEIRSATPRRRLASRLAQGGSFLANFLTGPSSRRMDIMISLRNHFQDKAPSASNSRCCVFLKHHSASAQAFLLRTDQCDAEAPDWPFRESV